MPFFCTLLRSARNATLLTGALLSGLGPVAPAWPQGAASEANLSEDPDALRKAAAVARTTGQAEVEERALRSILELDPKAEASWIDLSLFLEKQGRAEEVVELLKRSGERFSPPPSTLYRAAGRALIAADQPRHAIDILLEARENLLATQGSNRSPEWTDHALRKAYEKLGELSDGPHTVATDRDPAATLAAHRQGCEAGNTQAMVAFARLALTRIASGSVCQEGLQWLERAAGAGHGEAAAFLGKLLFYGRGECVVRAPEAPLEWLEAGAAADQPGAAYDLALALLMAGSDDASRSRGAALLVEATGHPDPLALETLAFFQATGHLAPAVPRDAANAGRLLTEAARFGSDGFSALIQETQTSEVYRTLINEGIQRLEKRVGLGQPAAMAFLARITIGLSGGFDPERPAFLAQKAAKKGQSMAMRVLGFAYLNGDGVTLDRKEGRRWQGRCAAAGNAFCRMFYGKALIEGEDLNRDVKAGLKWLRRAGEAGNWWAIADLGRLYDQGSHGIPRDPNEATKWKQQLADLGDAESKGWLLYHGDS